MHSVTCTGAVLEILLGDKVGQPMHPPDLFSLSIFVFLIPE